ncbi:MAG TPA: hypothetical protein VFU26_02195 [Gaiellaceae bacterium]|nr:hypothetical protein [Gaiellaceae bacterium]
MTTNGYGLWALVVFNSLLFVVAARKEQTNFTAPSRARRRL